jgi:hypothetical protein
MQPIAIIGANIAAVYTASITMPMATATISIEANISPLFTTTSCLVQSNLFSIEE